MTIYEQLNAICQEWKGTIKTTADIKRTLAERFGTNATSVLPSDFCYNWWNQSIRTARPLFVRLNAGEYKCVGPDHPYTGVILWRPKGTELEQVVGEWDRGVRSIYDQARVLTEPAPSKVDCPSDERTSSEPRRPESTISSVLPLSRVQLDRLYEEYMEILHMEVHVFGCQPTETRHLIGRLGEFQCARLIGGHLVRRVNQEGFDVLGGDGQRISVKTTAQKAGFVSLNANTLDRVDDLMVLQYADGELKVVYFGPVAPAIAVCRTWEGRFELDISKARRLISTPPNA